MKAIRSIALAIVALMLLSMSPAHAASAPLSFCNNSADKVYLSAGYYSPGVNDDPNGAVMTGPFVSRGWFDVEPGQCTTVPNPFQARYMFWYGASKGFHDNEIAVTLMRDPDRHDFKFCVTNYFTGTNPVPAFTFESENASIQACDAAHDALWVVPTMVDTWVDPNVNFSGGH